MMTKKSSPGSPWTITSVPSSTDRRCASAAMCSSSSSVHSEKSHTFRSSATRSSTLGIPAPCSGDGHGSAVSLRGYTGSRAKWEVEHGLEEAALRGPQERQEGDRRREEEADDRAHAEEDTKCAGQAGSSGREAQAHRRNFAEDA